MDLWIFAVLAGLCIFTVYRAHYGRRVVLSRRKAANEYGCKPIHSRYPKIDPIFGLDVFFANASTAINRRFLKTINGRFELLGNTYGLKDCGSDIAIITREPEVIKSVLAARFQDYGLGDDRKAALCPLLGHAIFTNDGSAWEQSRAMLRPQFVRSQVRDMFMLEKHVSYLIDVIPRDGSTGTEFLFGEATNCLKHGLESQYMSDFVEAFHYSQDIVAMRMALGSLAAWMPNLKFCKSVQKVHEFIDHYTARALEYQKMENCEKRKFSGSDGRYIFLYDMVEHVQDPVKIRSELVSILAAGRDTTASLLSNCFFILAKRPDIWAKLQAEVRKLSSAPPTFDQLRECVYVRNTLNESLRLHPPVPINSRVALCDTVIPLGGGSDGMSPVLVPKGTTIVYSISGMHLRQDLFGPDADEFRRERWEGLRPGWKFLPFSGGPRICEIL